MDTQGQAKIDITLQKVCPRCHTETPFIHYGDGLITLGEHSTMELHVVAEEFLPCHHCGNPMYLRIQAQPYELANHLDSAVALAMNEQGSR